MNKIEGNNLKRIFEESNMVVVVDKDWGKEEWLVNNDKYCGKILTINRGYRCSIHYHKEKDETFFLLSGAVFLEAYDGKMFLLPGKLLHIKPGTKHRFTGVETSKIIEFSTHHEDSDSYKIIKGGKVPENEFRQILKEYEEYKASIA